jgi:ribonuclease HI
MNYTLYFDGCAEPTNPGIATYAWLLKDGRGEVMHFGSGVLDGTRTNNYAEYCAIGFGLKVAVEEMGPQDTLLCLGDSKLVVEQVNENWQCNKPELRKLRERIFEILEGVGLRVEFRWIPREQNEEADELCRIAWCKKTGRRFPERQKQKA